MARPRRAKATGNTAIDEGGASQAETSEAAPSDADPAFDPKADDTDEGPSRAPPKRKAAKRKRGRPRKKTLGKAIEENTEDDDVVVIENGERIPLPPKHGTPVQHTRPKRRSVGQPKMTIYVNAKGFGRGVNLPAAPVYLDDSCSVSDLKDAIYTACPYLPPIAQQLFHKDSEGDFVELDGESLNSLKDLGLAALGPHDVWLECNLDLLPPALKPAQAAQRSPQVISGTPVRSPLQPGTTGTPTPISPVQPNQLAIVSRVEEEAPRALSPPGFDSPDTVHPSYGHPDTPLAGGLPVHHRETASVRERKKNKRWSNEEIENLLLGLMHYGLSSWTDICTRWHFNGRTTVDLKDKWRNLVKNVRDNRPMRGMALTEEAKSRIWRIMRENGMPLESHAGPSHGIHPNPIPTETVS